MAAIKSKLVLTGFMASGKSAVGRALAARLGRRFIDSDHEIVVRAGKSIAQIFAEDGEPAFRRLESEVIADLAAAPEPAVIATGGGALVDEGNHAALARVGIVVCLMARPEVIARRVSGSNVARPKLTGSDLPLEERIVQLMEERKAAYARASLVIDTSDLTVGAAAETVLRMLEGQDSEGHKQEGQD